MSVDPQRPTTITVTERTRRLLESVKGDGESYDNLLQALLEKSRFDDAFYEEIQRRWDSEPRVSGTKVLARVGSG